MAASTALYMYIAQNLSNLTTGHSHGMRARHIFYKRKTVSFISMKHWPVTVLNI